MVEFTFLLGIYIAIAGQEPVQRVYPIDSLDKCTTAAAGLLKVYQEKLPLESSVQVSCIIKRDPAA